MLHATMLGGLGAVDPNACVDRCAEGLDIFDPSTYGTYRSCSLGCGTQVTQATGDPTYERCMNACDSVLSSNDGGAAYGACIHRCGLQAGDRYGGTETVTDLPGNVDPNLDPGPIAPGPFQKKPATNWYRMAGFAAIALAATLGGVALYARHAHAAT